MGEAVYTVGHSTRPLDDFVLLLRENGVRLLADVRRYPVSRRYPHFTGAALAASLAREDVAYRHASDLGGHREPQPGSPNTALRVAAFRGYADHMATLVFRAALDRLEESAATRRTVILCAEADPQRCHRQLVADALVARGTQVRHILGPGRVEPHALHPAARLTPQGTLVYDRR